jgi:hypothetical protein
VQIFNEGMAASRTDAQNIKILTCEVPLVAKLLYLTLGKCAEIHSPSAPHTEQTMKSLLLAMVLSVTLLAPALARADASPQGCTSSDDKAKGCDKDPATVPETGIAILVASGILAVGGIAVLRRKQQSN